MQILFPYLGEFLQERELNWTSVSDTASIVQTSIHYSLKQCLAPGTSYVQDNRCRRIPGLASTIPKRPVMCAIVFGHDIFQKRAEERTEMQGKNCIAKALATEILATMWICPAASVFVNISPRLRLPTPWADSQYSKCSTWSPQRHSTSDWGAIMEASCVLSHRNSLCCSLCQTRMSHRRTSAPPLWSQ